MLVTSSPCENFATSLQHSNQLSSWEGGADRDMDVDDADDAFKIPNVLMPSDLQSWAMSIHTATTGIAMDRPIHFDVEPGADHLVRFVGFYRAKATGAICLLLRYLHVSWLLKATTPFYLMQRLDDILL